jgi:hypothetical protein
MFPNTIGGAIDLDNLADVLSSIFSRQTGVALERLHAYRRGLATNLYELGVPDIVIQAIGRYEDIRTT